MPIDKHAKEDEKGGMRSIVIEERRPPLRFGGFTLNLDQHSLFCNGERVRITEKPLETLIFLIENRGRVVEKKELFGSVWKGTFVTDDTLVHAVREIRRILGDDKDDARFIQTVPRQGYRFIGEVFIESNSEETRSDQIVFAPFTEPVLYEQAPVKDKPAFGSDKRFWFGMAGFVAILTSVLVFLYFRETPPTARYETQQQITGGEFSASKPAFSPDGKLMLCVWSSPETRGFGDIFVISVADGRSIPITTRENPSGDMPVFTADGNNNVVYSRYRTGTTGDRMPDLYIVPSSGLTKPHLYIADAAGAGFSPDGRSVAYTKHLPTGKRLWLSPTNDLQQPIEIASEGFTPRFSPDGKWLAYTTSNPEKGLGDLWITDTATFTEHRNLTNELQQLYGLAWTSAGSIVFSSKRSGINMLWQVSLDDTEIKPLMPTFGGYAIAPSVSPDGRTLIFQYGRIAKNVHLAKLGSEQPQDLTNEEIHEWARFSPSGKQIATIVQRHDFGKDLSIIELGEPSQRRSKRFALVDGNPESVSWLDERRLAYLAYNVELNQTRAVVIDTGNGMPTPLTRPFEGKAEWLAVHPDGTKAAVILIDADKRQKIVLRDLETQAERTIAEGKEYAGLRWLADGSALSWSGPNRSADPASSGVWLWPTNGVAARQVATDGFSPVWSRDGGSVFFAKMNGLWKENQGKEGAIQSWPDNVVYFDVADDQVAFIQAKEIVKAQVYSVELTGGK